MKNLISALTLTLSLGLAACGGMESDADIEGTTDEYTTEGDESLDTSEQALTSGFCHVVYVRGAFRGTGKCVASNSCTLSPANEPECPISNFVSGQNVASCNQNTYNTAAPCSW